MILKFEREKPKTRVLNCKPTKSLIGLRCSVHHSAACINLSPTPNYDPHVGLIDNLKVCGIVRWYRAHCVTAVAKHHVPSRAWRK